MNLSKIDLPETIAALLARGEPLTVAQLAAATGKSQPSISTAIKALGKLVHRMGAARSTRYALKKDILGLPAQQSLLWNDPDIGGRMPQHWGTLTYLHGNWIHIKSAERDWLVQGKLPWFLTPLRPQGFLGKALAQTRPDLPSNPEHWTLAQILGVIISNSEECSGAFSFGGLTAAHFAPTDDATNLGEYYDLRADASNTGTIHGSSAAGEQPKFVIAGSNFDYFIVKFTPPCSTPFGQRWRALLLLEKLALEVLQSHGISSARTQIIQSKQRTYLQSKRFDRNSIGERQHVVAIAALHDEFTSGNWTNWVTTSEALAKLGIITAQELSQVATVFAFGHDIGNTDMHSGNLSFFVDNVITQKIRLAPVYDMLPMMWRPDPHQGLSDNPVRQQFMPTGFAQEQNKARKWAIEFWEQAAILDIGADLQAASLESARRLKTNFADV
jgi:HipA-like C-terminal domain/Bacterial regulatory protein, arsR family